MEWKRTKTMTKGKTMVEMIDDIYGRKFEGDES